MMNREQYTAFVLSTFPTAKLAIRQLAESGWKVTLADNAPANFHVYASKVVDGVPTIVAVTSTIPMHTTQLQAARLTTAWAKLWEMVNK